MEFVVENLSPTRKKIAFTLTADDVNAAINTAVKGFQKDLSLPGFRKGKVPASVVEKRFGEDVYARATQDEINGLLQKTLKESGLTPVSSMEMDNHDAFARDTVIQVQRHLRRAARNRVPQTTKASKSIRPRPTCPTTT